MSANRVIFILRNNIHRYSANIDVNGIGLICKAGADTSTAHVTHILPFLLPVDISYSMNVDENFFFDK